MQKQFESSLAVRLLTPLLAWACVVVVVSALGACGQKGALSLPSAANAASAPAR